MAEKTVEIAVSLLLPDVPDERDECIERLQALLQAHKGILLTHLHLDHTPVDLCIHYEPNLASLEAVERLAHDAGAELRDGHVHSQIPFRASGSADLAEALADELERLGGMLHASVNYAAGLVFVAYDQKKLSRGEIERLMRQFGADPLVGQVGEKRIEHSHRHDHDQAHTHDHIPGRALVHAHEHAHTHGSAPVFLPRSLQERWTLIMIGVGGLLLALGWAGEQFWGLPHGAAVVLFVFSYVASAYDTVQHAIPAILRGKFDTDALMLAAALGAAALGEWAEGAFLLFLFGIGHAGEHYALDRARNAINALGELAPRTARVRRGGQIVEEAVEHLAIGDIAVIRPGDRIPVDGVVRLGEGAVDQSPITGESVAALKKPGDEVFAGTVNQDAALEVEVARLADDTTLSRVMRLVAEAQSQQSPTQQFTGRFTARFVPLVLVLTVLTAVIPPLAGWMSFSQSFYRAMLLLVAASPCALAIGAPAAVLAGIAQAARNGVLIKGGVHLENLGRLAVMAFDKTGTLTEGKFRLTEVIPLDGASPEEILSVAGAAEQQSGHPLALAVVEEAQKRRLCLPAVSGLENVAGCGVRCQVGGAAVWIGSRRLFEAPEAALEGRAAELIQRLEGDGQTAMLVRCDGQYLGALALADVPRPQAAGTLERLRRLGVGRLVMLTGDNPAAAQRIAVQVGVTDVEAGLLPQDKLGTIRRLQEQYGVTAMVGDGVNDAPALAAATVGIAMGGAGTAAALETADVALMADDLSKLPFAVGLGRASQAIIRQNLAIALGVIGLLIVTSVFGLAQMGWTVAAHEGSTVVAALNALRLLRYEGK